MERKVASLIKGVPYLSQSDKPLHKYLSLWRTGDNMHYMGSTLISIGTV